MPLSIPPVGSAPLYAKNKATGETYLVSAPGGSSSSEVEVDPVEPTGDWELWADTSAVGQIPPSQGGDYLPLEGGTLTGPLVLAADPVAPLEAATKAYADGVRDTGFVLAPGWARIYSHRPAGAFRQGQTVTIHGSIVADGLAIADWTHYTVGTVSVGFRPIAPFRFPIWWTIGPLSNPCYGEIHPEGPITVVSQEAFTMAANNVVDFNATYTLD